jgi:hypothetical protein
VPQGKWEMNEAKKARLTDIPEFHPALDSRVPEFRFTSGEPQPTTRKLKKLNKKNKLSFLGEALVDDEQNRILVRQIMEMYQNLNFRDEKSKSEKIEKINALHTEELPFKEKGNIPCPL